MTRSEYVDLKVDDGTEMRAFVVHPDGAGPHPGLLLFQEALGVNSQIRGVAERWARQGFVTIAPEMFHRTAPGFEADVLDMTVLMPLLKALTPDGMVADARAAHTWLVARSDVDASRVAAAGFCMGGRAAYLANAELPLAASISYYGGSIAPALLDRAARLHGAQLFFWAGNDQGIPPEQHRAVTDAVRAAGKAFVDVEFSGVNHGFFNEQIPGRHDPAAAAQSWALSVAFLEQTVGR
ncbi:dienelactone hydrolase (plasmid) [Gemmatirosa kalamazoonensis]|uniref:Dienelactone hydrolase n=1 Tax=Gemmatirosa kalamazoonensis TaxID=861299 RepID=W0RRT9_9BACT|nr:dienelactone hydrolase family protein [Gemmatirosa kalamazoonensis]AHG92298.1 dienelactone hydrolase [Gemmatirosa kalamazoonensis]